MVGYSLAAADVAALLDRALESDDTALRLAVNARSGLPGPRLNLRLVGELAAAVADEAVAGSRVEALERLLDSWVAVDSGDDDPAVVLGCAAVLSYGAVAVARPEWWEDELTKLSTAALDPRWRVRELVAAALQRMLAADWDRAVAAMHGWASDAHPLRVRAAAAAVAEPPLLGDATRWVGATEVLAAAVATLGALPAERRRAQDVRTLRKALGYALSVVAGASGDFGLLERCATSADADLRWVAATNASKRRLERWPEQLGALRQRLGG